MGSLPLQILDVWLAFATATFRLRRSVITCGTLGILLAIAIRLASRIALVGSRSGSGLWR
jgi:hypothetical protein